MLESFWNIFSFNLLPTLPLPFSLFSFIALLAFSIIPTIIACLRKTVERHKIYIFNIIIFLLFYICFFIPIENFYFNRGDMTIFAKTLYALIFIGSIFDKPESKERILKLKSFFYNIHAILKQIKQKKGKNNDKPKNNKKWNNCFRHRST